MSEVLIPFLGHTVVFPDREKMKRVADRRMFVEPSIQSIADTLPTPPDTCDWSKADSIKFPILGNDRAGDCYYAAILHLAQCFAGQFGEVPQFDVEEVLNRYYKLSGGDNGLSDSDVFPEYKRGILGPDGKYKILDSLVVDNSKPDTIRMAIWAFTGSLWTCSLPRGAANDAAPNALWDADGSSSVGGHAMIFSGYDKYYKTRTWGIVPAINVTDSFLRANDAEIIVVFSMDQFHPTTRLNAAGMTWDDAKAIWMSYGGRDVGAAPWGNTPPVPKPPIDPPTPPMPKGFRFVGDPIRVPFFGGTITPTGKIVSLNAPAGLGATDLLTLASDLIHILQSKEVTVLIETGKKVVWDVRDKNYLALISDAQQLIPNVLTVVNQIELVLKPYFPGTFSGRMGFDWQSLIGMLPAIIQLLRLITGK